MLFVGVTATTGVAAFSTSVANTQSNTEFDFTMYQYEICPFCNKVKAVMDYLKLPYSVVEVDPVSKKQVVV